MSNFFIFVNVKERKEKKRKNRYVEKKVQKPTDIKLKGLFSNGNRNSLPGPTFGLRCVSSRKQRSFPLSGV